MSLGQKDKAIHWAEALGLSAAVHVAAAYLLFNFSVDLDRLMPDEADERPDLLITSLVLDNNAIVSATSQAEGTEEAEEIDAANELNDGAFVDPETLDPVDETDEIIDAVVPDDPIEELDPIPEEPEEIIEEPEAIAEVEEPETVEEILEPDPIGEPDAPEEVAAVEEDPETVDGTDLLDAPEPETAPEEIEPVEQLAEQAPEPVSPLQPEEPETLAPTGTSPLGSGTDTLAAATPSTQALVPERIAPRATGIGTISTAAAAAAATRPVRSLPTVAPPVPGSPEALVSELVTRIRTNLSDTCLVAIPQMADNGAPELVVVTSSEADAGPYAAAVLDGIEPRPGQRTVLMDERQCAVLDYVRQNRSYPAFRMSFGLEIDQISSGEQLTGAVGGTAGRYVSLILIDDNGVVQDIGQYLSFIGDQARFDVPLRRSGATRDTKQLLVAIGTNSRPRAIDEQNGQLAADYFKALSDEIGTNVPIVMLPFDVR